MPGFLRRINGLRRKERLAGSNALVTGSGRITSANATCRDVRPTGSRYRLDLQDVSLAG